MVSFLFVDFSSPGYLKILLWRLITSPLLQAFADLLRPSKQLQQSQHFGNIAAILTIKRLVTAAESTSHNGRFAGTRDAQERLRLSSAPSQVCAHTPALCAFLLTKLVFPMKIPGLQLLGRSLLLAHREGWQRRQGQTPLLSEKCRCLSVQGSLTESVSSSPLARLHTVICNSKLLIL